MKARAVVAGVGPGVTTVAMGDHVALNWAPNCGRCFYCLHGSPEPLRSLPGAGLGRHDAGRHDALFALPDGAPVYQYCSLGCFSQWTVVPASSCVPLPTPCRWPWPR